MPILIALSCSCWLPSCSARNGGCAMCWRSTARPAGSSRDRRGTGPASARRGRLAACDGRRRPTSATTTIPTRSRCGSPAASRRPLDRRGGGGGARGVACGAARARRAGLHASLHLVKNLIWIDRIASIILLRRRWCLPSCTCRPCWCCSSWPAVALLAIRVAVHVTTLPVEFDASFGKALPVLARGRYLAPAICRPRATCSRPPPTPMSPRRWRRCSTSRAGSGYCGSRVRNGDRPRHRCVCRRPNDRATLARMAARLETSRSMGRRQGCMQMTRPLDRRRTPGDSHLRSARPRNGRRGQ